MADGSFEAPEAVGVGVASGLGPLVRRGWWCGVCRVEVAPYRALCDACNGDERHERHAKMLLPAWATIPERFRDAHAWEWEPMRRETLRRVASAGASILLTGKPGAGKTAMACAALGARLVAAGQRDADERLFHAALGMMYVTDQQLTRAVTEHPFGSRQEPPLFRAALAAELLVLDELGYKLTGFTKVGCDVLFERYDRGLPTIVTTGHSRAHVEAHWGGGAGRRIWEQSHEVPLDALPRLAVVR